MNKASKILESLTATLGEAGAREVAQSAVDKGLAENDLGPQPSIDNAIVLEVIKSLTDAKVVIPGTPAGTTQVQVAASTAASQAAGSQAADVDIELTLAALQGMTEGLNAKVDAMTVYLNKSFAATAQLFQLMLGGVSGVDKRVIEQGAQVVELKKSLDGRRAPQSTAGRVAEPNLQDRAATEVVAGQATELSQRVALQQLIQVEIQKSAAADQQNPGSQKARMKQLTEASFALTRPIPAVDIAAAYNLQLPA